MKKSLPFAYANKGVFKTTGKIDFIDSIIKAVANEGINHTTIIVKEALYIIRMRYHLYNENYIYEIYRWCNGTYENI